MIRFKTIEPGQADKPAAATPLPAVTAPQPEPEATQPAEDEPEPAPKAKGLTRKTPLRAKKPAAAGLFRD